MTPADTAIWFDLDGTLVVTDDYGAIIEQACTAVGIEGEQRTAFVEAYDTAFLDGFQNLREEPYHHAAREGIAATEVDADPDAFVTELLEAECEAGRVPRVVRRTLAALEEYRLGVLTNGIDDWQREKLSHHDLAEYFDAVVVSDTAGAHKPDRRVFELAAERLSAETHLMVGDDREADIDGARAAGWNAMHVSTPDDLPTVLERLDG